MKKQKYFGTDGIRGRVGEPPVSADWILKLGWALGRVISRNGHGKVLIGKDTRISGYMFESALEAGLAASGTDILLLGPMPTSGIAYLTRTLHADAGIVISASHNSYDDNGIKFFSAEGYKISDEIELAIEYELSKSLKTVNSSDLGRAKRITDAEGRYIEFCKSTFSNKHTNNYKLKGLKIVLDCANGAAYHVAPCVFSELGAEVITIGDKPDGFNINNNCGSTCLQSIIDQVLTTGADLGIALDGDADRLICIDHTGEIVDGDEILFIISKLYKDLGCLSGGVVGTVMSNLGLEKALKDYNIPFSRSAVGDRNVMQMLDEKNWLLGGESSGHILCLDVHTTGDGIISALKILSAMCFANKSLCELRRPIKKYPQVLLNVPVVEKKEVLNGLLVKDALDLAKIKLKDQGRVLLRSSGTESVIRVMVEGVDKRIITNVAQEIAMAVSQELQPA